MKQFFKVFLNFLILASLSVPVARAIVSNQSQWQVFADTWLFAVYAVVIYVVGISTIQTIWDK